MDIKDQVAEILEEKRAKIHYELGSNSIFNPYYVVSSTELANQIHDLYLAWFKEQNSLKLI